MKGIDVQIEKQRLLFSTYLWAANSCSWYGRCQVNYREDKAIPEVLTSGNEYRDVLLDDTKDAICFFKVLPERTLNEATVEIYFAVNLNKLYSSVTERATEYALSEAVEWTVKGGLFKVDSIMDGFEAWRGFGMVKKEDNLQPFYLFKLKTIVNYVLTC